MYDDIYETNNNLGIMVYDFEDKDYLEENAFGNIKCSDRTNLDELVLAYKSAEDGSMEKDELCAGIAGALISLINKFANKYPNSMREDIVSAGLSSVFEEAIPAYDAAKGARFSTFAYNKIYNAMREFFRKNERQVSVPRNYYDDLAKINRVTSEYYTKNGENPNNEYIAEKTGLTVNKVKKTKCDFMSDIQMDTLIDDDGECSIIDTIADGTQNEDGIGAGSFDYYFSAIKKDEDRRVFLTVMGMDEHGNVKGTPTGANISALSRALGLSRAQAVAAFERVKKQVCNIYSDICLAA